MLPIVAITLCLCVLAVWGITMVIRAAMRRLGLDPMTVMLWFGLAEWPSERPAPRPAEACDGRRPRARIGRRRLA